MTKVLHRAIAEHRSLRRAVGPLSGSWPYRARSAWTTGRSTWPGAPWPYGSAARATCGAVYRKASDKKVSDLTVKEEQQVRACQALGLYPPQ